MIRSPLEDGSDAPLSSIIIVTYGQRALTAQCLDSLQDALGDKLGSEFELVLVDNASPDDTGELLGQWSGRAQVLMLGENLDFAGGCNRGAAAAGGEVLIFLNNDTEVPSGAMEQLRDQVLEPGVALAGCRLLYPNRTIQHGGVAFVDGGDDLGSPKPVHLFVGADSSLPVSRSCFETDAVTGACIAVERAAFDAVGGFDTTFRNDYEDIDLCLRLRAAGHQVVYRGDVTVIHHEGATRGRGTGLSDSPAKRATLQHNHRHFFARWGKLLDRDSELAARVFDGELVPLMPRLRHGAAELAVIGEPSGYRSADYEARAWLHSFVDAGRQVTAIDLVTPVLRPRLQAAAAQELDHALALGLAPGSTLFYIEAGPHDRRRMQENTIVRVGSAQTQLDLRSAQQVWTPSPAVTQGLLDNGLSPELVRTLAPPIPLLPPGAGGAGLLVVLPTHDRAMTGVILDSLRSLKAGPAIRLLPTAYVRNIGRDIHELLPGAELLRPCADETRFAQLAGAADAVAVFDPGDPFERRCLLAGATGTPVFGAGASGPAHWVLGDLCTPTSTLEARPGPLGRALTAFLDSAARPTAGDFPGLQLTTAASVGSPSTRTL